MNDYQVLEVEYRCQAGESDYKYLLSRDTVYKRNNDGIVIQIIGVLWDITEMKQTSRDLE